MKSKSKTPTHFKNYEEMLKYFKKCKHLNPVLKGLVLSYIDGMMGFVADLALDPKIKNTKYIHSSDEVFDTWVEGNNTSRKFYVNQRCKLTEEGILKFNEYEEKNG